VTRVCGWLEGETRRTCGSRSKAIVLRADRRTHSTIHLIEVRDESGSTRRFHLKTVNEIGDGRAATASVVTREYAVLCELWQRFASHPYLGVVRPVVCMPDDLCLLTEDFSGAKLDAVLAQAHRFQRRSEVERLAMLCRRAGEWLRHFQQFTAVRNAGRYDVSELFAYCEDRLRIIAQGPAICPEGRLAAGAREVLGRLASDISAAELVLTGRQNDYRPDNMLTRDGRIVVLDFTGFRQGPPLYDFVKFWMRLDYLAFGPRSAGAEVERLKRAYEDGWGTPGAMAAPLARMLRLANILDKMSELVEAPARSLWRRILERRWYRHLCQQALDAVSASL
jgi:hypothetical protein